MALRLNDEVDRLGALALLVRLDLERNALSLSQILQSRPLDRCDVHEHVASAVVRLDEAVAPFSIEELDRPSHGHRVSSPAMLRRDALVSAARPDRTFTAGKLGHLDEPALGRRSVWISSGLHHSAATIRGSGT